MKAQKLPGVRGSFIAKTAHRTRMFLYAVVGTITELAAYKAACEATGNPAVEDKEYGLLYFTSINHGREATMGITKEGKVWASNDKIRAAQELRGVVSDAAVDQLIIEAMNSGSYAQPVKVEAETVEETAE